MPISSLELRINQVPLNRQFLIKKAMLDYQQLSKFLNDYGIAVTVEDLKSPKAETILGVYGALIKFIDPKPPQLDFASLQCVEDPDHHKGSIQVIHIYRTFEQIMQYCNFKDFSFQDIVAPTAKRTRKILSLAYNFFCHYSSNLPLLEKVEHKNEEILNDIQELEAKKLFIIGEINKKHEVIERMKEMEISDKMKEELEVLIDEKKRVKATYSVVKNKILDASIKVRDSQLKESRLEEEKRELQQQIIHSPEDIQMQLAELEQHIEAAAAEQKSTREQIGYLTKILDSTVLLQPRIDQCITLCSEIAELQKKIKKTEESCAHFEQTAEELRRKSLEKPANLEHLHKRLLSLQKRNSREASRLIREKESLKITYDEKMRSFQGIRKAYAEEIDNLNSKIARLKEDVAAQEEALDSTRLKRKEYTVKNKKEVDEFLMKLRQDTNVFNKIVKEVGLQKKS